MSYYIGFLVLFLKDSVIIIQKTRNLLMHDFFKIWLPLIFLIILSFFLTYRFTVNKPINELSIATGRESGAYYKFALQYQALLKKEKVKLNIHTTAGSIEALKLLKEKKVDIAFVQGGTVDQESKTLLHSLASIYYEPIWIFYKGRELTYLNELTNKKISIGEKGSGVRPIAIELLANNGINKTNTTLYEYSTKESIQKLKNSEIDLFFTITSPKSELIKSILSDESIKLMSLQRAKAYRQSYLYYKVLTLGEGSINLKENIPSHDVQLLAKTAFLAAHEDLDSKLERLILRSVKSIHSQKGVFEESNEFPNQLQLEIPIGNDAKRYLEHGDSFLERIFPYNVAQQIDRFKLLIIPILTLLIPFFKGALPLFRWTTRRKIYKWYKTIGTLDKGLMLLSKKKLLENKKELESLLNQVKEETDVPLSYMGEYYNLMLHIEMIITQIEKRIKKL